MVSRNDKKESFSSQFRRNRMRAFSELLKENKLSAVTILDIGGTLNYWKMNLPYLEDGLVAEIDVMNLPPQEDETRHINNVSLRAYAGDALDDSTFRLSKYDVIHSNSVIEHVGNLSSQIKMADSILRTGAFYWIQTPAKSFPLEPHFYFPFFAYLPLGMRSFLLRQTNLGFHKRESNWLQSRITCEDTRLLNKKEFQSMFLSSKVLVEKLGFVTKSYIATNLIEKDSSRKNL